MAEPERNVALLIDADNASPAALDRVLTVLAELGTVNIRRAYGNWRKPALKGWSDLTLQRAIEPQQQFDISKGKNATDMKMTIDAMDLLFRGRIQGFGIMSSDSDFLPLAMRIRQEGLPVYGFGTAATPDPFKQACTRFIDVTAPTGSGGGEARAGGRRAVDPELLDLLVDAYNAVKRDESGYARLSEVGQLAGNRSSFDVRNYGYSRLSELIESIPNFTAEKRNGALYVKRVR